MRFIFCIQNPQSGFYEVIFPLKDDGKPAIDTRPRFTNGQTGHLARVGVSERAENLLRENIFYNI